MKLLSEDERKDIEAEIDAEFEQKVKDDLAEDLQFYLDYKDCLHTEEGCDFFANLNLEGFEE